MLDHLVIGDTVRITVQGRSLTGTVTRVTPHSLEYRIHEPRPGRGDVGVWKPDLDGGEVELWGVREFPPNVATCVTEVVVRAAAEQIVQNWLDEKHPAGRDGRWVIHPARITPLGPHTFLIRQERHLEP